MKRLLLDTHALIWFFESDTRLPVAVKHILEDPENEVSVSIASFWEIAIKISLNKLALGKSIAEMFQECDNQGITVLPVSQQVVEKVAVLPLHHRDPFDRIIIATAESELLEVVSTDTQFDAYPVRRLWD